MTALASRSARLAAAPVDCWARFCQVRSNLAGGMLLQLAFLEPDCLGQLRICWAQ